ncbi:MAG: hypothetical protein H6654_17815 [Ardenticatenaceae bacterium]|nr:hypothetical protein [Anaerolineales bacterium]MCB8937385.1 hypothetical protein [Ardenticatenaceae bacterium]MCB8975420.1 hypothetical protein [Ardenticatenaceae bacterium]
MNYLATVFPKAGRRRLPVSRDQAMLLMAAFNEIMLGLDTLLAHGLNNTILLREWIPIVFGPTAGILLLVAGLIALRNRKTAAWLATAVFLASIIVGVLGAYFHFVRGVLPTAPMGARVTLNLLVWAPPFLAPFAFAGIGVLGISAAWQELPTGSGLLQLPFNRTVQMPYSKTRAYFFLVSLGTLVALVSSALDHARQPWENPWLWLPLIVGVFATAVSAGMGALNRKLTPEDVTIYITAMVLLILVGAVGAYFHIQADLTSQSTIVPERFLRGAPFMSPLLFSNMGIVGLLALLSPEES